MEQSSIYRRRNLWRKTWYGNTIRLGEKRITLPGFVAIVNGEAKELIQGTSAKQTQANDELTEEIMQDEQKAFDDFFKKYKGE